MNKMTPTKRMSMVLSRLLFLGEGTAYSLVAGNGELPRNAPAGIG
jgi:hypothetical protein